MELKVILMQFILFTLVEGAIYATFFYKWCKCNKFKIYQLIIMCIGNYIISTSLLPLLYQFTMIVWMGLCICFVQGKIKKKYFIYPAIGMGGLMVVEIIYNIILNFATNIDLLNITSSGGISDIDNVVYLFIFLLPTKLLEIFIIQRWEVNMKSWVGSVPRK